MVARHIKILIVLSISIFSIGCSNNEKIKEDKTSNFISQIKFHKVGDVRKIDDYNEVDIIKLKTNDGNLNNNNLYTKQVFYEYPNLIKITINKILKDKEQINIYSDIDLQINPKLEVLYTNAKIVGDYNEDVTALIIIKNSNLEDYEKDALKFYSEKYPEKIEYNEKIIKFNI